MTSSNGYAEAISPYDGKLTGRVEIPAGTIIPPVVANGIVYILHLKTPNSWPCGKMRHAC